MIHDLTVDGDFRGRSRWEIINRPKDDSPEDEIVLTGDWNERHTKRVIQNQRVEPTMCDCCGSPLVYKPWNFERPLPLCKKCDKLHEYLEELDPLDLSSVVLQTTDELIVRRNKPWDAIEEQERPKYADNVLLWD